MAKVRFQTEQYEWSHGRKPKGFGWWMFQGPDGAYLEAKGNYTEAQQAVTRQAREKYSDKPVIVLVVAP